MIKDKKTMNITRLLMCVLCVSCLSTSAFAQEEPVDKYKGNAELGYVKTTGNTETQTLNFKSKVEANYNKWRQTLKLEALNSRDGDVTTAEKYLGSLKTDYRFTKRDYAFGLLAYENDRFSGYKYQANISVGYGRQVIDRKNLWLNLEGGPGARFSELDETGESQDEFILFLAGDFGWQISETSLFEQELSTEIGEDSTITRSTTSLSAQIVGSLAMKLSYKVKHTSDVPPDIEKTDTETSVTLVYKF
jgi:putative salt-induced outer membrane protein